MRRRFAVAALSLVLVGCPATAPESVEGVVVANVGAGRVEVSDLLGSLRALARQGDLPRGGQFHALCKRTLDAQIVEEVLLTEATTRKLAPSPAVVDAEIAALRGDPPVGGVLADAIDLYGSEAAWRAVVARRLTVQAAEQALREELREGTSVTPEQVDAATPRYADRLRKPGRIRARQLFSEDPAVMRGMHARLEGGESFEALAKEQGLPDGGDLGMMSLEAAPTMLVQASERLAPGEHTAVLRSPLGYHVFELLGREAPSTIEGDEARALVEQWLVGEAVESRLRAWLAARTDALGVVVQEDVVRRVMCCREGEPYLAPAEEI